MGSSRFTTRSRSAIAALLCALVSTQASAANVCDPTTGTNCVQVDKPASGANSAGSILNRPAVKATYSASTATANSGVVVAAASASPFFCIYGSGTKTIIVQRIYLSGATLTAVQYLNYVIAKYSTAASGGTAVALTQVPNDSNSPAASASIVNVYTAAPTSGTLVGAVSSKRTLGQSTTAAAAGTSDVIEFDFRTAGTETSGIYLRATTQGVCANFGAAPASAVTLAVRVEWTEQATTLEP